MLFRSANLRAFEDELEEVSWFARTLRPPTQYARLRVLGDAGSKAFVGRDDWWFFHQDVRYLVEPLGATRGGVPTKREVVSATVSFRDQLAARGIRLLVVPAPGKPSVYPEMLTQRAGRDVQAARAGDSSLAVPAVSSHTLAVMAELTANNVEVVDLFAVFARARASEWPSESWRYYLPRDTHWTAEGAQLAAAAVADRVRELGWAPSATRHYETRSVLVHRPGDVVKMLRVPRIEQLYEPTAILCEQVFDPATGEPYKDDPAASILVLGDSFLRIYEREEQAEPDSAGFIAHLARNLSQPVASIVNDGGASTLVRQELAREPDLLAGKSLVIWEFVERDIRFGLGGWEDIKMP